MFWVGAVSMGLGFALTWRWSPASLGQFWLVAIGTRLILLGMAPGDDIWRYLWEGLIQTHGISPYDLPPNAPELVPLRPDWWGAINHPGVSAIYPPLTQLGLRVLAGIQPSVLLFKLGFVAADLAACGLLVRWFGVGGAAVYGWNPLTIYSFAGGAHYDSWFMLPIVMAWGIADRGRGASRWLGAALCLGLSVAVKWVSLPLLVFVGWRAGRDRNLGFALLTLLVGLLPMAIAALPFCADATCPLVPVSSTFVSHGRSAEFLPYVTSLVWPATLKANWIYGPPLALATLWLLWNSRHFLAFAERYFMVLLALSPIVHAWYFTWLTPFAAASRNWGTRMVGLSAFVYFMLPHRQFLGHGNWFLSNGERIVLWLPYVLGIAYSTWQSQGRGLHSAPEKSTS